MLQENELVPFQATSLLGEKLLVLAPHPDDEVLGCGGVLALNASLNRQVTVLVATDGAAADGSKRDADVYRDRRERETVAGLATLGIATPPRFLRLRDRELDAARATLMTHLRETIFEVRPDLVLAPSPVEMHPDHVALAMALFDLIQSDESIRGALSIARVAFYEVSQPIRPNTIVDISTVAAQKRLAVDAHSSQQGIRDYSRFIRGLNEYRTMSLPPEVTAAEGYWVTPADALRTMPWTELCRALSPLGQPLAEVTRAAIDATVVVRTKDRHAWLRESLSSIIANRHPARIVVVNDGGESPRELIAGLSSDIDLVENERSLGRAEAMNRGVQAASTPWLAFLDDD
ncbi:MAG: PIG-L family deacetylase, partial [Thermoanaerobaculia bacterium]